MLLATENQISRGISNIERLSPQDLPKRNMWLLWYSEPQKVRDNMGAIERQLAQLEDVVKDVGELQRMIEAKSGHPASSIVPAQPHHDRPVPVEQDFSLEPRTR